MKRDSAGQRWMAIPLILLVMLIIPRVFHYLRCGGATWQWGMLMSPSVLLVAIAVAWHRPCKWVYNLVVTGLAINLCITVTDIWLGAPHLVHRAHEGVSLSNVALLYAFSAVVSQHWGPPIRSQMRMQTVLASLLAILSLAIALFWKATA